jgi:hypothetical protein
MNGAGSWFHGMVAGFIKFGFEWIDLRDLLLRMELCLPQPRSPPAGPLGIQHRMRQRVPSNIELAGGLDRSFRIENGPPFEKKFPIKLRL